MPKELTGMAEAESLVREALRLLRKSKVDRFILKLVGYGLQVAVQKAFEAGRRSPRQ